MNFKYKTTFASTVKAVVSEEKDKFLAKASLEELCKYIPNINTARNVDLLPCAFNACLGNRINRNDDGMSSKDLVAISKFFLFKSINIEHRRHKAIGVIVNYAFTKFGSDEQISSEDAAKSEDPINLTLGAVIWRLVNPEMAELIENASDPTHEDHLKISASWELGFTGYSIGCVDGDSKDLTNAQIITDPEEIEKMSGYLRAFGGKGQYNNKKIYRIIGSESLPLGIGFTETPAAQVKGIATPKTDEDIIDINDSESKASDFGVCPKCKAKSPNGTKYYDGTKGTVQCGKCGATALSEMWQHYNNGGDPIKNKENSSQSKKILVNTEEKAIAMKITKLEDINDEALKQVKASEITEWVKSELSKAALDYAKEKDGMKTELKAAQDTQVKLTEDCKKLQTDLQQVSATLEDMKKEKEARAKQDSFNSRMGKLDDVFSLSDQEREVIASDIVELTDDAFASYEKKLSILLAAKKKSSMQEQKSKKDAGNNNTGHDSENDQEDETDKEREKAGKGKPSFLKDSKAKKVKKEAPKKDDAEEEQDEEDEEEQEGEAKKKTAKASVDGQDVVDNAIDNAEKTTSIPNTTNADEPTILDKYQKAFGVDQWISDVKLTDEKN